MNFNRIFWQLFFSYFIITIIAVTALGWLVVTIQEKSYLNNTRLDLQTRSELINKRIFSEITNARPGSLDSLCKDLAQASNTRITIILPTGIVIGDSEADSRKMENHQGRPEISTALQNEYGNSTRYSSTLHQNLMYVAVPMLIDNQIIGVVRTAIPLHTTNKLISKHKYEVALAVIIIVLLAAISSLYVSRKISRPLEELTKGAQAYANGDLSLRLEIPDSKEIGSLAESMNQMAAQLEERLQLVNQQRNEQEAMFSSMGEGVVAIDNDNCILKINQAAADILAIDQENVIGKTVQEIIRNVELQNIIDQAKDSGNSIEGRITISDKEEKILQVNATILRNLDSEKFGVLLVLNDFTRILRLEKIRSDFVANVSHELKTPITAIKGFVETLQEGAVDNIQDTKRFLDIIASHSNRLEEIIEDLLTLSRIEQSSTGTGIQLEDHSLNEIVNSALQNCLDAAKIKSINLSSQAGTDFEIKANAALLELAIANLINNAVNHNIAGTEVIVNAGRVEEQIIISIEDNGSGIPYEHQKRIFERFYRISSSRSRDHGGSGLGLAIVKHIAIAHFGSVSLESEPGHGSKFIIQLPLHK